MFRFKCFFDFAKEERWLSEMAARGWALHSVAFGYRFNPAPPEQAVYKIDYRTFRDKWDFADYCALFEDSGWKHVAGSKGSGAQYFKKVSADGSEDIFSDAASRAGRYQRLAQMWLCMAAAFLPLLVVNWPHMDNFLHPKALYLTPGLWEMSGPDFWTHFLFETPFALLRGYAGIAWAVAVLLYAFFAVKSWRLYRKTLRQSGK